MAMSEGIGWEAGLLTVLLFAAATLYSSVGHAGASAYLAAMGLFGLAPDQMKPAALTLNVAVATLATWRYVRNGCFCMRIWVLFTSASIPCAVLGGYLTLPSAVYKPVVGAILLLAAARFLSEPWLTPRSTPDPSQQTPEPIRPLRWPLALLAGAGIGLLSGLTGTGGGIFLSPLILVMRWASTRETSGISAAFILANSIAGLGGLLARGSTLPPALGIWLIAVLAGGWIGTCLGVRRLSIPILRKLLGVVLVIAGGKLLLSELSWSVVFPSGRSGPDGAH
jgi:uncharacterized membrane protein YfcA